MNMKKRISAIILIIALVTILGAIPLTTNAATYPTQAVAVNWMKSVIGGSYQGPNSECPSLVKAYLPKVFGLSLTTSGNGKDVYKNVPTQYPDYFTKYDFKSGFILKVGDIISFNGPSSSGHVGIVYEISGNSITIIEQYNGSGGVVKNTKTVTGTTFGTYGSILGVARPTFTSQTLAPPIIYFASKNLKKGDGLRFSISNVSQTGNRIIIRRLTNAPDKTNSNEAGVDLYDSDLISAWKTDGLPYPTYGEPNKTTFASFKVNANDTVLSEIAVNKLTPGWYKVAVQARKPGYSGSWSWDYFRVD